MYSYLMVSEVARQRMAEQHEAARKAQAGGGQSRKATKASATARRPTCSNCRRSPTTWTARSAWRTTRRRRMRGLLTPPTAAGYSAPRPGHTGVARPRLADGVGTRDYKMPRTSAISVTIDVSRIAVRPGATLLPWARIYHLAGQPGCIRRAARTSRRPRSPGCSRSFRPITGCTGCCAGIPVALAAWPGTTRGLRRGRPRRHTARRGPNSPRNCRRTRSTPCSPPIAPRDAGSPPPRGRSPSSSARCAARSSRRGCRASESG